MKKVNLRELYPSIYPSDVYIEVEDEVEEVFASDRKKEAAYERQMYRHKAQYSLDRNDGIALETLVHGLTPDIILEESSSGKNCLRLSGRFQRSRHGGFMLTSIWA